MKPKMVCAALLMLLSAGCGKKDPAPEILSVQHEPPPTPTAPSTAPVTAAEPEATPPQLDASTVDEPMPPLDEVEGVHVSARCDFVGVEPERLATGELTVYRAANGDKLLRIEHLNTAGSVPMTLGYARVRQPDTAEELKQVVAIGQLRAANGNMNYYVAGQAAVDRWPALVLVSQQDGALIAYCALAPAK